MNKGIVFLACGGKGNRLRAVLDLEDDLPKGLAVIIGSRPLIAYQLEHFISLGLPIVVSFSNQKSYNRFNHYVKAGLIPRYHYLLSFHPYHMENLPIDIIKLSKPYNLLKKRFDFVLISGEDVWCEVSHIKKLVDNYEKFRTSCYTITNTSHYMSAVADFPRIICDGKLFITDLASGEGESEEALVLPALLDKELFLSYVREPPNTYRSIFIKKSVQKGIKIMVVRPNNYVNLNYIEDYNRLLKIFKSSLS